MPRRAIQKISLADVEFVAFRLAKRGMEGSEPIPAFNTRFQNRLESCVETPFQTFAGKSLYKGLENKAAILFYLMIKNHPFENGNKRIAVTTLLYFLLVNDKWLEVSPWKLYKFARYVAQSQPVSKEKVVGEIQNFVSTHMTGA